MGNQSFDSSLEKSFAEYLYQLGYPKESVLYAPLIRSVSDQKAYRPDFIIVDPRKNERVAIVEVKGSSLLDEQKVWSQLRAYSREIGNDKIPVFLVTPGDALDPQHPFRLHIFNVESGLLPAELSLFPPYETLTAEGIAGRKDDIRKKQSEVSDSFQKVSWYLSVFLIFIVLADFVCSRFGVVLVTTERMALIGGAVALFIIPFAQKFKGLGIEWEKASKDKRDDS